MRSTAMLLSVWPLVVACGGTEMQPSNTTSDSWSSETGTTPLTFEAQARTGRKLYAARCASCHGDAGEGKKAPALVGVSAGALPLDPPPTAKVRSVQFRTAADVAGFVVHHMPADAPGSLREDQYWAILAFDLKANGVDLGNKRLDATSAPGVVL